ncbi:family 78 glycoside hydrolase catalytic domain [Massilibacteroides sp.]|uniref:family 78 glycoside hydrolase catalytic domain n=1 Tax=Massilibacteroides sp. TaxID=2034766 RepID=UPI002635FF4A|nr:family 78 glycoside hydrolase catalytic domain [Massilibacteroides sp.]MDD4515760.1 family 78 glycoside hydrolase catalytic domain [Massilibacteroides sp.]
MSATKLKRIPPLLFFMFLFVACSGNKLSSLLVEYAEAPLGIDVDRPHFSWQMVSSERGQAQTAYRIMVVDEAKQQVWDSGKVNSDISLNIEYEGEKLQPCTRYQWKLEVWNQDNKMLSSESWFETGLMNPSIEAWEGAKWIGGGDEDLVLYPDYLPIFNINYTVLLDKESESTKAGFVFGANDPRLMDRDMNIYNLQNEENESYVEVELDISGMNSGKTAFLSIYRVGYAPNDKKDVPLERLAVPASIINNSNKYEAHTVYLKTMYSSTEFYIGGEDEANKIGKVVINPIGNSWDYICFPLLCEIGFSMKPNQKATFSTVNVHNYRVPNNILYTMPDKSYPVNGADDGSFIVSDIRKKSMPMLRSVFSSKKTKVAKARLYITARGIYEAYLNGKRIGDDYFNPGLTQYNKHHLYQTYDVTEYVHPGENAIGITMGEGWWSGAITYMGYLWNLFGDRQSILAKLVITYADGTEEMIVSQPDTWSYFDDGPVVYSSFFQGEVYDAQKEDQIAGWTEASYDASNWKRATEVNQENAIVHDKDIEAGRMPAVNDFSNMQLVGQYGQTVKKVKELTAISMEEVRPGVYVYDMGQNMAGIPRIALSGEQPGKEIILRFAEVKYPDLPEFADNVGMIMLENIRGALAQDIYITKGGNEIIHPHFTFHGYRFVEITGISNALPLEAVKGDVLSSIHGLASSYQTSNKEVNKLWDNIIWSTRGNFLSIPTDCPQRNERMGWSGDISVFSRTANYLSDIPQFLRRHMQAMRDTQREDGRFADVAPVGGGFGGILWGSAGITVAWESYLQYNDIRMLSEHYDAMEAYIDYLLTYIDPQTGLLTEGNLGDWLGPEQDKNDNTLLWEAYFIFDLEIMQRVASALNKEEDAKRFAGLYVERKAFFNRTYFHPETGQTIHSGFRQPEKKGEIIGTQTSYVLPLAFGICDEQTKEKAVKNLTYCIDHETKVGEKIYPPYSLMTGFIGTAWINRVLTDLGYSERAYRILQQKTYPSWLYSVEQGATTIWERLNSYTKEQGFSGNNSMNSFNHYSFGAIGSWMYNHSLGIERDEKHPGFKHFILQPEPDLSKQMSWAKGYYDSPYGRIESSWTIKNETYDYHFVVPANTTATLYLPAGSIDQVSENNAPITNNSAIEVIGKTDKKVILKLKSGEYQFRANR